MAKLPRYERQENRKICGRKVSQDVKKEQNTQTTVFPPRLWLNEFMFFSI